MSAKKAFCVQLEEIGSHRRYAQLKVLVDRSTKGVGGIVVLHNVIPPTDLSTKRVSLHRHKDVDEVIYCITGEGIALIGPSPAKLQEIPFQAPCLVFAPATHYHRVINRTDKNIESLVLYSPRGARLKSFDEIIEKAEAIEAEVR